MKTTDNPAIKVFREANEAVVAQARSGARKAEVAAGWSKVRAGFTRAGGYISKLSRFTGKLMSVFNVVGIVADVIEAQRLYDAGYRQVPIYSPGSQFPVGYQWVPMDSIEYHRATDRAAGRDMI